MKIVFTVHSYYPNKDGVQAVTRYLAEGLASRGHNVCVITHEIEGEPTYERKNNVDIIRVNAVTIHTFNHGDKKTVQSIIIKKTNDADALINVCAQTALTDWSFPLLKQLKCKRVLYLHGIIDTKISKKDFESISVFAHKLWNRYRSKFYYAINKRYLKEYDVVTQLHRFDEGFEYFKNKLGIESVVIENAADNSFFLEKKENHFNLQNKYIINVANYMKRKNQEFILKAFYMCSLFDYSLVFIGSTKNDYYYKLCELKKELDEKYGIRDVHILSEVPREYVHEYVNNATIYAMGSLWEAFPISIIESMASGIPFVSTNVGITRYLPGGIVVNSIDEMSYWFDCLGTNIQLANSIGVSGKIYAEHSLRIEDKIDELENLIAMNINNG